jgi:hypothetical protein
MTKKEKQAQETLGGTTVYVVTNPQYGWDCVCGVYFSKADAKDEYPDKDQYVIHEKTIY